MRSDHAGPVVMTVGAGVVVVSSMLGWVRSGSVLRSSYATLDIIERLGFAPPGAARVAIRLWPLMPLLVVAAVVLAWWGQRYAALCLALVGGAYAATMGVVLATADPDTRQVSVTAAPVWTAVGAAVLVAGSILGVVRAVPSADAHP